MAAAEGVAPAVPAGDRAARGPSLRPGARSRAVVRAPDLVPYPRAERRSVRSIIVPVPEAFLGYLRTDGIVLPRVPDGRRSTATTPV